LLRRAHSARNPRRIGFASQQPTDAQIVQQTSCLCYDVDVPRTTLQLEDDAMKVAKAHAQRHRLTLGQAVSELVRKAAERPLVTEERSGLRVLRLSRRSPKVTTARVDRLREDLP
jgi:uncharacterized protein YbbK (DUF523 family)